VSLDPTIKYRIKKKGQPGPDCNWKIDRPDLGFVGQGYLFEVIANRCRDWRRANGVPIGLGFEDELEQALCRQHPSACETDDPREPIQPRRLNYRDVLVGTQVMASFIAKGMPVVDQAEAERRAAICANCIANQDFGRPCSGICGKLEEIVTKIVGGKHTSKDDSLNSCVICGCYLKAAVWMDRETQWKPLSEHQKIQFEQIPNCWKRPPIVVDK